MKIALLLEFASSVPNKYYLKFKDDHYKIRDSYLHHGKMVKKLFSLTNNVPNWDHQELETNLGKWFPEESDVKLLTEQGWCPDIGLPKQTEDDAWMNKSWPAGRIQ
ncbi:unnamed protein product [Urochloa humidicola]